MSSGLQSHYFYPREEVNSWLTAKGLSPLRDRTSAEVLLRRPELNLAAICELGFPGSELEESVREQIEIQVKYKGYIERDLEILEGVRKNEQLRIPLDMDFDGVPGLSNEVKGGLSSLALRLLGRPQG